MDELNVQELIDAAIAPLLVQIKVLEKRIDELEDIVADVPDDVYP